MFLTLRVLYAIVPLGALSILACSPTDARAASNDWRTYIAGPAVRLNNPASILNAQANDGQITNPGGALVADGSSATITRTGANTPTLAIDFGSPFSGKIEVAFGDTVTAPLGIAFSQRREFLQIGSDTSEFYLGDLTVTGRPGMTWRADVRRGFRYCLLYLTANGTVAIDAIRLYHTPFLGTSATYDGHFLCNDDLFSRIWYGCVYTQELCTTGGYGIDGPWEIEDGALSISYAGGSEFGLTVPGASWTNYILDFDFKIMPAGKVCGWAFRATDDANTYMWQVIAAESSANPNILRRHIRQNGNWTSITSVNLPFQVHEGETHHVRTDLSGNTIRTYLDGQLIDTFTDGTFTTGRIGFRSDSTEHFHVDNVMVSNLAGVLFQDTFDPGDTLVLDRTKWQRAELLTINDGAKRDRYWYGGDFYPAQRTMYVAHYEPTVVAGTLRDAAAHQFTQATENQYGGILRGKLPASNASSYMTDSGFSAHWLDDYTFWLILALHHHWMHTGDTALVNELYPNLTAVMEWANRKMNGQGLINLDQGDWYWSFLRTGGVTAFNALYVQTLRCSARMASATGHSADATTWNARADSVQAAINAQLYDSARHLYYDSQSDHTHCPLDANTLTLLYGVADASKTPFMLDQIAALMWGPYGTLSSAPPYDTWGHNQQVWPWYVQYEAEARFRANDDLRAFEAIRRPWSLMVDGDPGKTTWEFITGTGGVDSGLRNTDHAFSAGAAWLMSEYVAGIRPTSAGFATFDIIPHPGQLTSVDCTMPTPTGGVSIQYTVDRTANTYNADINIPGATTARVAVPRLSGRGTVTIDGQQVWTRSGAADNATSDNYYLYFPNIAPGQHTVAAVFDPPNVKPDFDLDGDVDQSDFGHFQICFTGSGNPQTDLACQDARLDADLDVDQNDLAIFLRCHTGEGAAPTQGCDK